MKKSSKHKIAKIFCGNSCLNKKALCFKRSWDEVEAMLGKGNKCCGKCKH
jgi:hypothetical protein